MFGILKKYLFTAMTFFSCNVLIVNSLECVSMNTRECKLRSEVINVNTNESVFYPYSITIINAEGVVILLMTHMLSYVFLILLKT